MTDRRKHSQSDGWYLTPSEAHALQGSSSRGWRCSCGWRFAAEHRVDALDVIRDHRVAAMPEGQVSA